MTTRKTIAIVGATGNMGTAIAKSLGKNRDHRLLLMANDQSKLEDLRQVLHKLGVEGDTLSRAKEASSP